MHVVIIFASTTNGLFQIDNYYKAALPGESVHFDMTLVNNEVNRETFLIHHVWENSVLYLPMDEGSGSIAYDQSGFGNDGTIEGASWVDGKYGKALSFDGESNYVNVGNDATLNISTVFTVAFWILHSGGTSGIYSTSGMNTRAGVLNIYVSNTVIAAHIHGVPAIVISTTGDFLSAWKHIAITRSNLDVWKIFVDGAEVASVTDAAAVSVTDANNIGRNNYGYCNGTIDEMRIYNRALTAEEIGWLYNNSWSESLSRYTVELEPGESTQVTFRVKVPEDARVGSVQKFLLTAFPLSNPEHVETKTVTVEVLPKYGVEVSLDENEKKGKPGEILNFQAAIRNLGNIEDTYDIQAEGGEGWNLSLPAESLTVPAEEVGSFNISVTVPLDALPGDYTSFRIQAASRGNQNLTTNVNGTAIATATYRFNITADPELRQASPGSEAIFSLELKNLGTAPDTIGLEVENLIGWDIKVDPSSISVEIGETGKATVRVRVPEDALIGQANTITIRAVSGGDPTVSANSSISIEVVTPFWDIPDVRFLVGLSIGVLVGATLISTIILRRAKTNRKENRRS
jgi:hypothetical protein